METPFNMMIVGRTNCGKTFYLLQLLETEYKNHFENIFLICSTFEYNKTYQNWKYVKDEDFIVISCKQDEVECWLGKIVNYAKGTNSMIILDDCAQSKLMKDRSSEIVDLAFSGRHFGISTVLISQQFKSVTKPFRDNTTKLVMFLNPSRRDWKVILDDVLPVSKQETEKIMRSLQTKYTRLEVVIDEGTYKVITP